MIALLISSAFATHSLLLGHYYCDEILQGYCDEIVLGYYDEIPESL